MHKCTGELVKAKAKRESLGKANARMRRLVGELHAVVDAHHEKPTQRHPGVTCAAACGHARTGCCSILTTVDLAEAEYIVARNRETVERALPRLLEAEAKLDAAGLTDRMFEAMLNEDDRELEHDASALYRRLELPCAFLDDGNRCSIYRDRPLACRTHFVLSPPSECSEWDIPEGDARYIRLDKGTRAGAPALLIRGVLKANRPITWGTLPRMVLVAHRRSQS